MPPPPPPPPPPPAAADTSKDTPSKGGTAVPFSAYTPPTGKPGRPPKYTGGSSPPPSVASGEKKRQYGQCPNCEKKMTAEGLRYHILNRVCLPSGRGTKRPAPSPQPGSAEKTGVAASVTPGNAHKKPKGAMAMAKTSSNAISGPCPDFVYYVVKGSLPFSRPKKQSKAETSTPSDTLLLLPQADYDYWHYRLNLYFCNTWGDVRSLGESVYSDVKHRFLRIHAVKGYRYSEKDEDFFANHDRFNVWEDLGCNDDRLQEVFAQAEWTYPYSIRKIMYDDTRRGACVPDVLRTSSKYLSWSKSKTDKNWEAEMTIPAKEQTAIFKLIKNSGGKVREEPGLQDFLIADARHGRYSLDEIDTPFIREYRRAKLSDPKYDAVKARNSEVCENLKQTQASREAERAAREALPPAPPPPLPPPPPPMQQDPFGLGRPPPPPPPPALLQQSAAIVVSEEEENDESFHRLKNRLQHNDKGITTFKYVPESSADGPGSISSGANILCCFTTGWDIGRVTDKRQCNTKQKNEAKQMKCPVLVYYESDGMYWLHDLGLDDAPYLSEEIFQQLVDGKCTEEQEKEYLGYWCIVSSPETASSRAEVAADEKNDGNQKDHKGITVYDDKDEKWNEIFQDVVKFKERTGHLDPNYMTQPMIYKWLTAQRYLLRDKSPRMTAEKKKCLDDIGFDWKGYDRYWKDPPVHDEESEEEEEEEEEDNIEPQEILQTPGIEEKRTADARWNKKFHEICVYKAKHGHMNITSADLRYKWVNRQRHACRDNNPSFTSEKKRLLDSIGFDWKGFDADWKDGADEDKAGDQNKGGRGEEQVK